MTTTTSIEVKPTNEIIKSECQERRYKEIKMNIFNNGIPYDADKVLMYSRLTANEYYIILSTNKGYLLSCNLDLVHAEEQFSFICLQNEPVTEGLPTAINLFGYTLYDKKMDKLIDLRDGKVEKDTPIAA